MAALRSPSRHNPCPVVALFLILGALVSLASADTSVQSISKLPAFTALDPCAQHCFTNGCAGCLCGMLEDPLGCGYGCGTPGINDCVCRSDKQSVGASYLSSCISKACTVGNPSIDISSGVAIYTNYCASQGFAFMPPVTPAPAVPAPTGQAGQPTVYVTRTVVVAGVGAWNIPPSMWAYMSIFPLVYAASHFFSTASYHL